MDHATTLWGIAQERAVHIFAFDFGRYFLAASLIAALVWLLKRTAWPDHGLFGHGANRRAAGTVP